MDDDRRKLAAQWRRAMRQGDDEGVPVLDWWIFSRGSRVTLGGLGEIGGAIRKLGMVRSTLVALGIATWALVLAQLTRMTDFPAVYGLRCYRCGATEYAYSFRLLGGGVAEIALFVVMWLPIVGIPALFIFIISRRRSRRARRQSLSKGAH